MPDENKHIYGVKTKYEAGVPATLKNETESGVKKIINEIKEEQYASRKRLI